MDGYKHYIRVNEFGIIVYGFSSAFEELLEGDILIREDGPRHFHESFAEPLTDDQGQYRFKWNGGIVERSQDEMYPLSYWKQKRIEEITSQRDSEILVGFLTNAVASTPNIQMGYDETDQKNYRGLSNMLSLDPTMTSVKFLTGNHGLYEFTRDEFIQVIKDAYDHESSLVYKYLSLKSQIESAADKASLDAIVW